MRDRRSFQFSCGALTLVAACAGTTAPTDAGAPPDAPVIDVVTPADRPVTDVPVSTDLPAPQDVVRADVADVPGGPCPAEPPASASPCTREALACQYGRDPRESCRTTATCTAGAWQIVTPRCPALLDPAMCPATREMAAGTDCAMMNATCDYAGLGCTCTNCRSFPVSGCNGPVRWRCTAPSMEPGCPAVQPNLGAVCAMDGQRCGYDCEATGTNGGRLCRGGVWEAAENNCPISSRAAKRDIRYLSAAESAEVARAALGTRLATYEYTDPALRGPRRLGFLYEDPTTHPYARNPDISGVDLYGYTSMLLATVQQQQRQIEALQRDVASLRAGAARRARR